MAAYFFAWLIPSGLDPANGGVKYFIFLTNWCYLAWCSYLIISAISATTTVIQVYCFQARSSGTARQSLLEKSIAKPYIDIDKPAGCCGRCNDKTTWYQKVQWVMFTLGVEAAITVSILYWGDTYNGWRITGVDANTHSVNGIIALIDIFFSGVPVCILHFIYPVLFCGTYVVFTGIYHAANGTNVQGDPYIYNVLDYGDSPGSATGWVLGITLVIIPVLHLIVFGLYSARFWITYYLWKRIEGEEPEDETRVTEEGKNEIEEVKESIP